MHTLIEFMKLPLPRRIRCVARDGTFMAVKAKEPHTVELYSLYGYFAEVWCDATNNEIIEVLPFRNFSRLDSYTDHISIGDVFG
jgi:hypothetical protein